MNEPNDMEAWIEGISIRGRMAYGLLCIEAACRHWAVDSPNLQASIEVLWEFTSSMSLDEWEAKTQDTMPFDCDDEYLEVGVVRVIAFGWGFDNLPDQCHAAVGEMLSMCLLIGLENLYGGYESFWTAAPLIEIISIMRRVDLGLPDTSRVSLSSAEEKGGWGDPRPREFFL